MKSLKGLLFKATVAKLAFLVTSIDLSSDSQLNSNWCVSVVTGRETNQPELLIYYTVA